MTGFVVERYGYTTASTLIAAVVTDMIANGFTQIFPTASFNASSAGTIFKVTLEASGTVDPLNGTGVATKQPWRVCFDVQTAQRCFVYAATPLQLANDGTVATEKSFVTGTGGGLQSIDVIGAIGDQMGTIIQGTPTTHAGTIDSTGLYTTAVSTSGAVGDETNKGLINRDASVGGSGQSYPMSYRLAISDHGIWLGVWEDAITQEQAAMFNWMLIQRPVDRTTGTVLITGKAPVFCINSIGKNYWQFVVRESDILRPGKRRIGDSNTEDSEGILNTVNQVSLSEDGKYIVTFPSRLNTSRYRYPHELDMIGITSADVVSQFSDVPLSVYSESAARSYKAMQASGSSNTGMRILVLQQGGGIS